MAFRAAFIGVNKHQDPGVPELGGAVRDAMALHALFADTFGDLDATLLLDGAATLEGIRTSLRSTLLDASEDDVVVITFAGHGTPGHQLVPFDADRASPGDTTLAMSELAEMFQQSRARAVLCVIDACFSGEAPARVLAGLPAPRAPLSDYSMFRGKGRFLLAAASPTQAAWEEATSGHGLLTQAVIEVLTSGEGPNDITAAVARIISMTRNAATAIGEIQDPCFVGGTEGELVLPPLTRGATWRALFPDLDAIRVAGPIAELAAFGLPQEVLDAWQSRFQGGLNSLQLEAVNRHRVLTGRSLLVVAPTSSGKTFVGEMGAVRAAVAGQKTVVLLPYRALVNEKYDDFSATYGPAGLRVIRCTGDYTDETGLLLSSRYDVALLTFEMFLGLAVGNPHVLRRIGLVVVDEAQFITDPTRGISVELILTLLRSARERGIRPQLIALSAVIGDINRFDEWLGCDKLVWTQRPVPLVEGVIDRAGILQQLTSDGVESEVQFIPRASIHQRGSSPSAQDVIVPLVRQLAEAGERVLIFRNTRGPAEGCAAYLARELGQPPAAQAISELSRVDLSTSGERLIECLGGGTAFHNSNLNREQRVVVERNFRSADGGIVALAATTTLAAGINTPASTVILAEQEFRGEDGRPFTVAEYKNMAGRAGRLGFNETGKAIIYAETPIERRHLFSRYVRGTPESVTSSFIDGDVRTWIIRLLSQVRSVEHSGVSRLLANTYGGYLLSMTDAGWEARAIQQVEVALSQFLQHELVEEIDGQIHLTQLGRACGQSSLSFDSALRLIEAIRRVRESELSPRQLVALVQLLPEADALWTPVRKKAQTEAIRVGQANRHFSGDVVRLLQSWPVDQYTYWARCKRAAILADWMAGEAIQAIERTYSVPFGGQIQQGDIQRFADGTRFFLQSAGAILAALGIIADGREAEFEHAMAELEFGVPAALLDFVRRPLSIPRGECMALAQVGVRTLDQLLALEPERLTQILGTTLAARLQREIAKLAA